MNRRHFFKSLAAMVGAASASPLIFIPKFEPVPWKSIAIQTKWTREEILMPIGDFDDPSMFFGHWRFITDNMMTERVYPHNAGEVFR